MKRDIGKFLLAAMVGAGLATILVAPASAQQYDNLVVFGDSLSDTGNAYAATGGSVPPSPPYDNGRASNGPLWVEDLAPKLGLTYNPALNYAYYGAGSGTANLVPGLPGLQQEVAAFVGTHPVADPKALYSIWAGANDFELLSVKDPTVTLNNLSTAITTLYNDGARDFLIPNLPDGGKLPGFRGTPFAGLASQLTVVYDAGLKNTISGLELQLPGAVFHLPDMYTGFQQVVADPGAYGLTNVTDGALLVGASDPNSYLFWDQVHPSARGHQIITDIAYASLVPEPGTLSLLAGMALSGTLLLRRRRKPRCDKN